jgi:S-adenosylmethionine hydrolase
MRPCITLLTDFGSADPYVGVMKGVIATICPDATVIDVTHEVPPQDVRTGAFFVERSFRYFPPGTVHVAVVDPGVGTARKPIALRAEGHLFVGPDNGIFGFASRPRAVILTQKKYFRGTISNTFHGRDIFAPVAAHLARGTPFENFGPPTKSLVRLSELAPRRTRGGMRARVVCVDRFGNLITNLELASFTSLRRPLLKAGTFTATSIAKSYGSVARGELALVLGGYDRLEIAARDGSAAKVLGLGAGALVELEDRR